MDVWPILDLRWNRLRFAAGPRGHKCMAWPSWTWMRLDEVVNWVWVRVLGRRASARKNTPILRVFLVILGL